MVFFVVPRNSFDPQDQTPSSREADSRTICLVLVIPNERQMNLPDLARNILWWMISFSCKEISDREWCAFLRLDSILVNVINGFFEIERIPLTLPTAFKSIDKRSNRSTDTGACLSECVRSSGRTPSSKFFLSLLCLSSARCLSHSS